MKIIPIVSAAVLVPLLALSPALAQDSSASSEVLNTPSLEVDASASASAQASASGDLNGLISALMAGNSATDLSAVTETSVINLVAVSTLQPSETPDALDNALDTNRPAVDQLRTDVDANSAISAKLTEAGYNSDQVLAIVTETDGSITVYVDDRT